MSEDTSYNISDLRSKLYPSFKLISRNWDLSTGVREERGDLATLDFPEHHETLVERINQVFFALDDALMAKNMDELLSTGNMNATVSKEQLQDIFGNAHTHYKELISDEPLEEHQFEARTKYMTEEAGYQALDEAIKLLESPTLRHIQRIKRQKLTADMDAEDIPQVDPNNDFVIAETSKYATDADFDQAANNLREIRDILEIG